MACAAHRSLRAPVAAALLRVPEPKAIIHTPGQPLSKPTWHPTSVTVRDVVIIGGGCSGLTAAIYASRARLDVLCVAGYEAGGQLMLTTDVENYPGFPDGILGPDLIENFRKQAERFGTSFLDRDVTAVDLSERPFKVTIEDEVVETRSIIVATGANARWLDLPSEARLRGHGISTCATCDGAFFRDKELIVAGGGDSACEEALFLTKFASKVTIVHRRDELRASKIMQERVLEHPKIEVLWNTEIVDYLGEKKVEGVRLIEHPEGNPKQNVPEEAWEDAGAHGGKTYDLAVDGVFIAIGHIPNTDIFDGQLDLAEQGYLKVHDRTRTNVEGVYASGDVHDTHYRQAVTAAGMGCMAAMDAEKWLESQH